MDKLCSPQLLFSLKLVLAYSAERALKISRKIRKLCSRSYSSLRIAFCLIIYPSAYCANVLH